MDELKAAGLSWKFYGGSCKTEETAPNGLQTCVSGVAGYDWSPCALGPNDAKAYGFRHAFDYAQAPLRPVPMVHRPVPPGDHIRWAQARQDT